MNLEDIVLFNLLVSIPLILTHFCYNSVYIDESTQTNFTFLDEISDERHKAINAGIKYGSNIDYNNTKLELVTDSNNGNWDGVFSSDLYLMYSLHQAFKPLILFSRSMFIEAAQPGLTYINYLQANLHSNFRTLFLPIDGIIYNNSLIEYEIQQFFKKMRLISLDYTMNNLMYSRWNREFYDYSLKRNNLKTVLNDRPFNMPFSFNTNYRNLSRVDNFELPEISEFTDN